MSKHRHKSRNIDGTRNPPFNNYMNNNPFGISPQQLLGLLGSNIDMSGIGNILSSMGQDGFNMNSVNTHMNDNKNINNTVSNADISLDKKKNSNDFKEITKQSFDDENIQFLQSIRNIVSDDKVQFVDKIIELYNSGAFKDFKKK